MKFPEEVDEVLKLLNTDSENPYLVWDLGTRAELLEFLEAERTSSVRTGTCDPAFGSNFKFTAHENELVVGAVFVRIFNQQPMFQLQEPKRFAVDLLEFLNGQAQYLYSLMSMAAPSQSPSTTAVSTTATGAVSPVQQGSSSSEKLIQSEMALEALSNVIKHNRGVEIQCIGHFKLLFCLLRLESCARVQEMTLHVLSNVTGSAECVEDVAASGVMGHLLQVAYGLQEQQQLTLSVLHSLMGDTRLVKEGLSAGVIVTLVHVFVTSKEEETRARAAEVLAKMSADKLMGPRVRIALAKFLPEIFLDAIKKSPETGVQMFETSHENPELIWNDQARRSLVSVVGTLANRCLGFGGGLAEYGKGRCAQFLDISLFYLPSQALPAFTGDSRQGLPTRRRQDQRGRRQRRARHRRHLRQAVHRQPRVGAEEAQGVPLRPAGGGAPGDDPAGAR